MDCALNRSHVFVLSSHNNLNVCCKCSLYVGDGDDISMSSMDNPEQFESQKQLKELMQQGVQL